MRGQEGLEVWRSPVEQHAPVVGFGAVGGEGVALEDCA